ncbi:MAG: hypothetical protein U1F37_18425 [Alphaproteobacteria bacterium]
MIGKAGPDNGRIRRRRGHGAAPGAGRRDNRASGQRVGSCANYGAAFAFAADGPNIDAVCRARVARAAEF